MEDTIWRISSLIISIFTPKLLDIILKKRKEKKDNCRKIRLIYLTFENIHNFSLDFQKSLQNYINEKSMSSLKKINDNFQKLIDSFLLFTVIFEEISENFRLYDPELNKEIKKFFGFKSKNLEIMIKILANDFINIKNKTINKIKFELEKMDPFNKYSENIYKLIIKSKQKISLIDDNEIQKLINEGNEIIESLKQLMEKIRNFLIENCEFQKL
ncbi:MAG: hypothetical protein ACTSRG_24510 [Candidatus Helarchaeota archaeon]